MKVRCAYDKMVALTDLKSHPKNRNKHPEEQIERLAKILAYQGVRRPARVSNQSGYITAGHGLKMAAHLLGWKEIPINFQDYDNDDQEYADVQADNAIAAWAELDKSEINTDIGDLGPDFDIEMLGLKDFTIDPSEIEIDPNAVDQRHVFEVVVECMDESDQERIYNRLTEEGLKCRVLTL